AELRGSATRRGSMRRDDRRPRADCRDLAPSEQGLYLQPVRFSWLAASRRAASRWPLCHAAADIEHVPPLSRSARLLGRARDLHFRRYLECESRRASADREVILQE